MWKYKQISHLEQILNSVAKEVADILLKKQLLQSSNNFQDETILVYLL